MDSLLVNGQSHLLNRTVAELPNLDLIAWLELMPLYPKIFWKEQDSPIMRAAVGSTLSFTNIPQFANEASLNARFYGGMRFGKNRQNDITWADFPDACFHLPQIEISQDEDQTQAIIYHLNDPLSPQPALSGHLANDPTFISRFDTPCFSKWKDHVETVLHSISSGNIAKLVLARKTSLEFANPLSPWPILSHLKRKAKRATLFAFAPSPNLCFLGATPEKLFKRENHHCIVDAVAGTRPRGATLEEDLQFEKELLRSDKERREFKIVKDYLDLNLRGLSQEMKWDGEDRILKASHVQHLHNRVKATLRHDVTDADLIAALHPTPALGGSPREESLQLLSEIESFDRGWYGAPFGMVSAERSSLYAAIRSALIQGRTLNLFAGTGLVPGSTPESEWAELEQKICPFTELFTQEAAWT